MPARLRKVKPLSIKCVLQLPDPSDEHTIDWNSILEKFADNVSVAGCFFSYISCSAGTDILSLVITCLGVT